MKREMSSPLLCHCRVVQLNGIQPCFYIYGWAPITEQYRYNPIFDHNVGCKGRVALTMR